MHSIIGDRCEMSTIPVSGRGCIMRKGILVARLDTQVFFGYSSFLTPLPRANIGANDIYL